MTNEIMTTSTGGLDFTSKDMIKTLKQTVAVGTNDAEFAMFSEVCKASGLNPFLKQIWCIVTGKDSYRKVQIMTGIDGFYEIANRHPQYDGSEIILSEEIIEIPIKITKWENGSSTYVDHIVEAPVSATCKVYRKDRKMPTSITVYWKEYAQDLVSSKGKLMIWGRMPRVLLSKCAESTALRKAFPQQMSGIYTQEEMPEGSIRNVKQNEPDIDVEPINYDLTGCENIMPEEAYLNMKKFLEENQCSLIRKGGKLIASCPVPLLKIESTVNKYNKLHQTALKNEMEAEAEIVPEAEAEAETQGIPNPEVEVKLETADSLEEKKLEEEELVAKDFQD